MMSYKKVSFTDRLIYALEQNNMSQQKLSELANINKGNMSRYINGKAKPKMDKIELMASILNVSGAWLMGYDVPMTDTNNKRKNIIYRINELNDDELDKLDVMISTMFDK